MHFLLLFKIKIFSKVADPFYCFTTCVKSIQSSTSSLITDNVRLVGFCKNDERGIFHCFRVICLDLYLFSLHILFFHLWDIYYCSQPIFSFNCLSFPHLFVAILWKYLDIKTPTNFVLNSFVYTESFKIECSQTKH